MMVPATAEMTVATTAASTGMVPVTGMKMAAMTKMTMTMMTTSTTETLEEMEGRPNGVDPNTHSTTNNNDNSDD